MAEGLDDDGGDVMQVTGLTTASIKREPDAPVNFKSEESCDSNYPSPEPACSMGLECTPSIHQDGTQLYALTNGHSAPGTPNHNHNHNHSNNHNHSPANSPEPDKGQQPPHINGNMAGLVTLQNLQNLAAMQGLPPMASLTSGLQNIAGLGAQFLNTPLNLSANATGSLQAGMTAQAHTVGSLLNAAQPSAQLGNPTPVAMPQLILASGQLVQGIQGAQLLIPTSQGLATQTILTIPVNHVTSGQMVNLALSNGQVVTTTLANLQNMAQPPPLPPPPPPPSLSAPANANTVPNQASNMGLNPASLPHLLNAGSHQQLLAAIQQTQLLNQQQQQQQHQQQQQQPLLTTTQVPMQHRSSHHHQHQHPNHSTQNHHYQPPEKTHPQHPQHPQHGSNGQLDATESSLHVISRLAASNADITITTTNHAPSSCHQKASSQYASSNGSQHSPNSDFMADSPNQPTINQTSSNVVDGINLDEIKEFAKAFKLRRLSLGLTQTQVGQALSITEGPAYSQSAICSALATQMYCAQLASQHQSMFEKLDITPKSAQKIKPVLEMWMKEAEESFHNNRYKVGQNHLTDFIGVEPSKKRKRRTSFTPQALELLNAHFERNTHPSGTEITALGHQLGYDREVIRIWFCNKRQALKNTVRMMSKGMM